MSNEEGTIHRIYPCKGCGGVMYALHVNSSEQPMLNIELDSNEALKVATMAWNLVSGLNPMRPQDFSRFLVYLGNVHLQQQHDDTEIN
jgi:hypothetical protein